MDNGHRILDGILGRRSDWFVTGSFGVFHGNSGRYDRYEDTLQFSQMVVLSENDIVPVPQRQNEGKMKIGILGIRGRVGSYLVSLGYTPIDLDITKELIVRRDEIETFDVIINCAALTSVDNCEKSDFVYYREAVKVNSTALETLRSVFSGRLIHLSTDYVFPCNSGPYIENAKRDPVNCYGITKFGGEVILQTHPSNAETVVVRTTGLFGNKDKPDFSHMVLEYLRNKRMLVASKQLHGNHTYIPHLCEGLLYVAKMELPSKFMYLHVASSDVMSRYEFALMIANVFELSSDFLFAAKSNKQIENWVAKRPSRGGLKVTRAKKLGVPIYTTLQGIQAYRRVLDG